MNTAAADAASSVASAAGGAALPAAATPSSSGADSGSSNSSTSNIPAQPAITDSAQTVAVSQPSAAADASLPALHASAAANMSAAAASVSVTATTAASSTSSSVPAVPALTLERDRHVRFFTMHLRMLPTGYESLDTSRMTLLYFCLSALDVLGAVEPVVGSSDGSVAPSNSTTGVPNRASIISWVLSQQIAPTVDAKGQRRTERCGFRGGPWLGQPLGQGHERGSPSSSEHDCAHVTMTYCALCILHMLRALDDERLDRTSILAALQHLQMPDGSIASTCQTQESDLRFLYCAAVITKLLRPQCITQPDSSNNSSNSSNNSRDDAPPFNIPLAITYIQRCVSYDGGISLVPGAEGHGGSTYCGVATLALLERMDVLTDRQQQRLLKWVLNNQGRAAEEAITPALDAAAVAAPAPTGGWRGRPYKPADSCYSFWLGASFAILHRQLSLPDSRHSWTDDVANRQFVLSCQQKTGGCAKHPGRFHPDLLHAYTSMAGLSLIGIDQQLRQLNCVIGVTDDSGD